ncbi:hypothetical protein Q5752_002861 [Cryptotrichosporon argae]
MRVAHRRLPRLTLHGRAAALIGAELLANTVAWIVAGVCLRGSDGILSLALLAWTIGLRHALDADHISAIDNATRQLVSRGRLPMTCGLFFSLGHSTIVIAVNIAIAISVDIYDKLNRVGSIGGIVGTAVSASFLFLVASINTFFLVQALRERRRARARELAGVPAEAAEIGIQGGGLIVRLVAPILRAVDRPWKLYPVGILFGFGFDTASSIALLAISAVASRGPNGEAIAHGKLVILPFTAGMSLIDSLDSVLMLYAYAQPKLRPFRLIERSYAEDDSNLAEQGETVQQLLETPIKEEATVEDGLVKDVDALEMAAAAAIVDGAQAEPSKPPIDAPEPDRSQGTERGAQSERMRRILAAKAQTMSSLSIALTLMSILVALAISLIEIMGLAADNCTPCQDAANDPDGGGLTGSWWRAWEAANDASGYVGAAIVGCFILVLAVYHAGRCGWKRYRTRRADKDA